MRHPLAGSQPTRRHPQNFARGHPLNQTTSIFHPAKECSVQQAYRTLGFRYWRTHHSKIEKLTASWLPVMWYCRIRVIKVEFDNRLFAVKPLLVRKFWTPLSVGAKTVATCELLLKRPARNEPELHTQNLTLSRLQEKL